MKRLKRKLEKSESIKKKGSDNLQTRPYKKIFLKDKLEKPIYSVQEVADLLNVHYNTIKNAIRTGRIKASKYGNYWTITPEAIKDYIELNNNNIK